MAPGDDQETVWQELLAGMACRSDKGGPYGTIADRVCGAADPQTEFLQLVRVVIRGSLSQIDTQRHPSRKRMVTEMAAFFGVEPKQFRRLLRSCGVIGPRD